MSRPASLPASIVACRWGSVKYAGTEMTAFRTFADVAASTAPSRWRSSAAAISCGRICPEAPPVPPPCRTALEVLPLGCTAVHLAGFSPVPWTVLRSVLEGVTQVPLDCTAQNPGRASHRSPWIVLHSMLQAVP